MRLTVFLLLCFSLLLSPYIGAEESEEEEKKIAFYNEFKPSFVANLNKGGRYIRCDIQLMTKDEVVLEEIKLHAPAIRHHLLLLFSEQDGKTLKNTKGKERLRKKALITANNVLKEISGTAGIGGLYFTSFYVQ